MEPTTTALAASAVALLSPYLAKAGTKAAEEVGKKLPEYAGKMWTAIWNTFKGKAASEEAAADLLDKPEDSMPQIVFQNQLIKALENDSAFAERLADLLHQAKSEAEREGGDTIRVGGDGTVATHGSAAASHDSVAAVGDVHGDITIGASKPQN